MAKWIPTKFPGVRYREHPTRKHGVAPDKYFAIYYRTGGKLKEEAIGWASQGNSAKEASIILAELKKNNRIGQGPQTLKEQREIAAKERKKAKAAEEELRRDQMTFGEFWHETYYPQAQTDKTPRSWRREQSFFKVWLDPVIGDVALKGISPIHLERIKRDMAKGRAKATSRAGQGDAPKPGCAPRTIAYCLDVVRQVFHHAQRVGAYAGEIPTSKVKKPKVDNRRLRFLTVADAHELLDGLAIRSPVLHDMALLSLHCGLRAGEIFSLTWRDVDLENEQLTLRDTKNSRTRQAFLTSAAKEVLSKMGKGADSDLLFPARGGGRRVQIPKVFNKVVTELGFNDNVSDRRDKVVFHTLRHSYASWLVMQGTPLYTVQKLLGHMSISMTERYSHLSPDHMKDAVCALEAVITSNKSNNSNKSNKSNESKWSN